MQSPFYSIIIPTLNEEKYIPFLLKSLDVQTYRNFQVIIIDSKSIDSTLDVIKNHQSFYPKKTILASVRNVSIQRNMGASCARGEYLLFMDADTQIHNHFLGSLHDKLLSNPVDFASTRAMPDTKKVIDQLVSDITYIGMSISTGLGFPFMSSQNLVIRRSSFEKLHGFDPTIVQAEDHDLVKRGAKMHLKGKIFFDLTHIVSYRRFHREGRLKVIGKIIYSTMYLIMKGSIKRPLFEYKMGGDAFK